MLENDMVNYKDLTREKLEKLIEEYTNYIQLNWCNIISIQKYFEKFFSYEECDIITEDYRKYEKFLRNQLNIGDVLKLIDLSKMLIQKSEPNEIVDELEDVISDIETLISENLVKDEDCEHCSSKLYLSDLPQYNSVCYTCEENF